MLFTLNWLQTIFPNTNGEITGHTEIKQVITNSRIETSDALFIPIIGEHFDGHDFILQAYENGITAALWDMKKSVPDQLPRDFPIFYVEDTTKALQHLASCYRDEVNPIVIGITGSNGKTTTKDIVSSITKEKYKTHFTNGNFNNEFGVPFTILSMDRDTEVLVLEMGMSSFGEIELLSKIAKPDYAIITNIGESHIEYLGSREGIAKAKLEITSGLKPTGKLIIDGDEALLSHVHANSNVKKVGFSEDNDFVITNIQLHHHQTTFSASDENSYTVSLLGKHNAKNASYGIVLGKLLDISVEQIQHALSSLTVTGMRFEMLTGENGVSIINDAYNASPTSMIAAIQVVKEMSGFQHKVLVLGDIYELGKDSRTLHKTVAEVIDDSPTAVYTVGEDSSVIAEIVRKKYPNLTVKHFHQKEDILPELKRFLSKDSLILFKASRGMELESIIDKIK
ncbi:UDP-N-acetylmuramoyl-tripeptide--D-alanyl-D-alanine ligase [Ornithinibacillus bavariensis]|uniref:UDP-N-acetylmuramoyl-tripeptide--D-alanyl-D-alanine ligase n=1 Tax=Ornithinibacillus bavariensis TaxID=545502 RepID=A0A919X723_9BACI|nr:UDP-N-acetylmuramoyl-tripeptide--D-alanyl-D-alanine ligase [Ornithinibacillus bavariensis]GIO26063.1 UDP-N-acetylmuramoyl-tripeptide--D-alanyl-D-alanine ligase [Ornithinibacillus bavariensis]